MFKITAEWFDMTRFPSRDNGPWDKAIRMQDLMIALQQRYVNGKDAIELVLESSKIAIPSGVGALRAHEILMGNFLDLFERATFAPEGSAHDKHLKAWIENMQKTGLLELFPNAFGFERQRGNKDPTQGEDAKRFPAEFCSGVGRRPYRVPHVMWEWSGECRRGASDAERQLKARPGLDGAGEAAFLQPEWIRTKRQQACR